MKLHLGCGEKYLTGYVNLDYPATEHTVMTVRADVSVDIRELVHPVNASGTVCPDGSVTEVRSHHVFEHFTRTDALRQLLKWRRWLAPQGALVIETPDFGACARMYSRPWSSRRRSFQLGRHMFGSQEASWANHLDFWDKRKFLFVLTRLGFTDIRIRHFHNSVSQRFSPGSFFDPFYNILGNILPDALYRRYGGHKLPNILVTARKDDGFTVNESSAVAEILGEYLVGREGEKMLKVWLDNFRDGR